MRDFVSQWMKWVAATVVVATLMLFVGYYMGYRKASVSCALSHLTSQESSAKSATIAVYVVGEVKHPGVYTLPMSSRVDRAVEAAGGFTASADVVAINLAMKLTDGMKVYVPTIRAHTISYSDDGSDKIPINTASESELQKIPGIGPVLASRIVEYRNAHGPFASYEDLLNVQGIGAKTLEKIKPYIEIP